MKKCIMGAAIAMALTVSMAHAATNPDDKAAVLNIAGHVNAPAAGCAVTLSTSSINISADQENLHWYTDHISSVDQAGVVEIGLDTTNSICKELSDQNRIAYTLNGTATPEGSNIVLANTDTSSTGAQGVGVSMYDAESLHQFKIGETIMPDANAKARIYLGLVQDNGFMTPGNVNSSLTVNISRL
ncbi:hypothetical protein INF73_21900 [Enterobacter cloacae complex sp. P6RS]|uniref:fimbrial protein n=2 Tax=unclassified Enterobacter cloacae complex TaxID=2757714 RepID=UPI001876C1B8|nr:hypothetical protein [Enterobacter cloacae complex sp. P6RS]MBE4994531.1 hypothetical protein [Enterobacter cloacae complex sp. P6RS]